MARRLNRFNGYKVDSKWEGQLAEGIFKNLRYHPCKLSYTKPATIHTYEPDWELRKGNKTIYIEAKGRFREMAEAKKYLYIRDSLCHTSSELVFLFMKPECPMPGAKRRKDGSIRTHSEFAEKNNFRWFHEGNIHLLLGKNYEKK